MATFAGVMSGTPVIAFLVGPGLRVSGVHGDVRETVWAEVRNLRNP